MGHFLRNAPIISIDSNESKAIKSKLKRESALIIKSGWDKNKEIKASRLYNNKKFGEKSIINVINSKPLIPDIKHTYHAGAFLRQCLNSKINYTTRCHLIEIKN